MSRATRFPKLKDLDEYTPTLSTVAAEWMASKCNAKPFTQYCIETEDELNELISSLEPEFDINIFTPNGLVFRGHADSSWELYSVVERFRQKLEKLHDVQSRTGPRDLDFSLTQLKSYLKISDAKYDGQLLSTLQHYGAPTTLLDWTESLHVALFFAFHDVLDYKVEYVALFVIDPRKVNEELELEWAGGKHKPFKFIFPNFFDLRIQAQKGLFSMPPQGGIYGLFPVEVKNALEPELPDEELSVNERKEYEQEIKKLQDSYPKNTLVKLKISQKLKAYVITYLENKGIHYDSLFPSKDMEYICNEIKQNVLGAIEKEVKEHVIDDSDE